MKYLESARDKVLMGPERKSRIPDEEANMITAYHEGGHAIVAYYTKDSHPLHKVRENSATCQLQYLIWYMCLGDYNPTRTKSGPYSLYTRERTVSRHKITIARNDGHNDGWSSR